MRKRPIKVRFPPESVALLWEPTTAGYTDTIILYWNPIRFLFFYL